MSAANGKSSNGASTNGAPGAPQEGQYHDIKPLRTKAFVFALLDPYSVLKNNKQNNVMTIAVLHIFCKDCKRYNGLKSQEKVQSRETALVFICQIIAKYSCVFTRKKLDCHFWTENILHHFSFFLLIVIANPRGV